MVEIDNGEILWRIYQEHCVWERHHEAQRSSATNVLVVVAAGVLSVIALDDGLTGIDLALAAFLVVVGLFGALMSAKQYERFARHQCLASAYRRALDDHFRDSRLLALRSEAESLHEARHPILGRLLRLNHLWTAIHLLTALFGVILSIIVLVDAIWQ